MLKELQRGLELTRTLRKYHADFPPNGLAIFLSLSDREGASCSELVDRLDMPKATVSRNLRMLGPLLSPHKEGMKLVELLHDPDDYRVRRAYLTEYGKEFASDLITALK
jgi:DNA-binding MarR family transcriptional regulator